MCAAVYKRPRNNFRSCRKLVRVGFFRLLLVEMVTPSGNVGFSLAEKCFDAGTLCRYLT